MDKTDARGKQHSESEPSKLILYHSLWKYRFETDLIQIRPCTLVPLSQIPVCLLFSSLLSFVQHIYTHVVCCIDLMHQLSAFKHCILDSISFLNDRVVEINYLNLSQVTCWMSIFFSLKIYRGSFLDKV